MPVQIWNFQPGWIVLSHLLSRKWASFLFVGKQGKPVLIRMLAAEVALSYQIFSASLKHPSPYMNGTLLLDLDGTLIENSFGQFLPAYLNAIGAYFSDLIPPDKLIAELLTGSNLTIENLRPDKTLHQVFYEYFYQTLELEEGIFKPRLEAFYREIYPGIRQVTRQKPEAIHFVERALQKDFQLVIATNPLFPRVAVEERLLWAGLPSSQYPFKMITCMENFHFTKPHLEYYAEILSQLGWPEGPIVSVGDDFTQDIFPSQSLGIPVFWIKTGKQAVEADMPYLNVPHGNHEEAFQWILSSQASDLTPNYDTMQSSLATLRATPAALLTLTEKINSVKWNIRPAVGEWALVEIICHLRDIDREINLPRIQKILKENNPLLAGLDTDQWSEQRGYLSQDGERALKEFVATRIELMDLLDKISPEEIKRTARHTILGWTTIEEQIRIAAAHERLHVKEFVKIASTVE